MTHSLLFFSFKYCDSVVLYIIVYIESRPLVVTLL